MMDMLKIVQQWKSIGEMDDVCLNYCKENLKEIEEFVEECRRQVTYYSIYKDEGTGKHYRAYVTRSRGYWDYNELVATGCVEVVPKEITKTIYVAVE